MTISHLPIILYNHGRNCDMKPNYSIEHVHIEETMDAVEPPPPDIKATFKNLHDWLIDICGF